MKFNHGLHLAYCTNVHRGESWTETLDALNRYTLQVRDRVSSEQPYAIGLRLSAQAARELSDSPTLAAFQKWLDQNQCYVFTINGFPYGRFHGTRVKEQVYAPDWSSPERLQYTNLLFDLLAKLVPAGLEGSVSTLPGSFKEFIQGPEQLAAIRRNLWQCVEHIAAVSESSGRQLHLGVEPEPLGLFENSAETVQFFEQMRSDRAYDERLEQHLGVNYDTCHFAVEFETPQDAIRHLQQHAIRISKIHLSSALRVHPTEEVRQALRAFADDVYLHQVVIRKADGVIERYRDLDLALSQTTPVASPGEEWRIHFHIPLHSQPTSLFQNTSDHIPAVLELLRLQPSLCSHLEMETYTWEVLPPELKNRSLVEQLVCEYDAIINQLRAHGFQRESWTDAGPVLTR